MPSLSQNQTKHLILNQFSPIGPATYRKIIAYFGNLETFWQATILDYLKAGLREKVAQDWQTFRRNFTEADLNKITNILEKENIKLLAYEDDNYPPLLREIDSAPPLLYYQGDLNILKQTNLAIVGSRQNTIYSARCLAEIIPELTRHQVVTVSGLAAGVDTLVHDLSLKNHGQTIAVLGSGLDRDSFYPRSNLQLRDLMIKTGSLIISEFPPLTRALRTNFPRRNRLIAGLSSAVLIAEAAKKSGALITANYALDFNREVLAVPGSIHSTTSEGTNNLIKAGAKVVTNISDILEVLAIEYDKATESGEKSSTNENSTLSGLAKSLKFLSPLEETIYKIIASLNNLGSNLATTDKIIIQSNLDTSAVNSTLSTMEIKGMIKNNFGAFELLK